MGNLIKNMRYTSGSFILAKSHSNKHLSIFIDDWMYIIGGKYLYKNDIIVYYLICKLWIVFLYETS